MSAREDDRARPGCFLSPSKNSVVHVTAPRPTSCDFTCSELSGTFDRTQRRISDAH
jgi:hypothetical protein